jgi:hypothetical protein
LKAYRQLRATRPRFPDSDKAALAIAATTPTLTTPSKQSVLWANCAAFWIDAGTLSKNFGPGNPGNQLDCKRGTRVFFGFTHKDVPKNHIFGDVVIQVPGYVAQTRSVRFGNNSMDKVNLPVPDGITGPTSYDNKALLFKRSGNQYVLTIGTASDRSVWRNRSKVKGLLYKVGKREFGFF